MAGSIESPVILCEHIAGVFGVNSFELDEGAYASFDEVAFTLFGAVVFGEYTEWALSTFTGLYVSESCLVVCDGDREYGVELIGLCGVCDACAGMKSFR